jgi:hypothetical protein
MRDHKFTRRISFNPPGNATPPLDVSPVLPVSDAISAARISSRPGAVIAKNPNGLRPALTLLSFCFTIKTYPARAVEE